MIAYAYQTLRHKTFDEIETEEFENILDLFAAIMAKGITSQLKRGLCREYIGRNEDLAVLRGRIDMNGSMRLLLNSKRQLCCSYDELSEDHLMNQILKTTAFKLLSSDRVKRKNRDALKASILYFSGVATLDPSTINWRSLKYNRNNVTYRMLMNVCYLVLSGLLLSTDPGKHRMASFLDEQHMARLYEKFILEYYKQHFPHFSPAAKQISWDAEGSIDYLPIMQSDIMLRNGKKRLIIDAKCYGKIAQTQFDTNTLRSAHLYQLFTYVKNEDKYNTGNVSGLLLYAKTDESFLPKTEYMLSGNTLGIRVLDLNVPFDQLRIQLGDIVTNWAGSLDGDQALASYQRSR